MGTMHCWNIFEWLGSEQLPNPYTNKICWGSEYQYIKQIYTKYIPITKPFYRYAMLNKTMKWSDLPRAFWGQNPIIILITTP